MARIESIDRGFKSGATGLILASSLGHAGVVKRLLAAGARADAADNSGCTALAGASENGHEAVVEELLGAGAYVDAADRHGATALMAASGNGHGGKGGCCGREPASQRRSRPRLPTSSGSSCMLCPQ
ncbi:Ankyrin-like protein [Diplonema papillatum]|nr:Ankyrin-like protein [Diplonema papillatum]KAJ9469309.1 Ankyrin-like protein [Diplonema papillatum]